MPTLPTDLRNKLERTCIAARNLSERAAKAALEALAVAHHDPYGHMTPEQRNLRNKLRARARQLGDTQDARPLELGLTTSHGADYLFASSPLFASAAGCRAVSKATALAYFSSPALVRHAPRKRRRG